MEVLNPEAEVSQNTTVQVSTFTHAGTVVINLPDILPNCAASDGNHDLLDTQGWCESVLVPEKSEMFHSELIKSDYKLLDFRIQLIKLEDLLPVSELETGTISKYYASHLIEKERTLRYQNKLYQCKTCERLFYEMTLWKMHSENCSIPIVRKGYSTCNYCQKTLETYHLREHMASHTGEKLFRCNICNRGFYWKANLKCHMILHSNARPFVCTVCGMSFKRKVTLRQHNIIQCGEKKFKCQNCEKTFCSKQSLKYHLEEHFKTGAYECKICKKVFITKRKLKDHNKDVHSGRYSCNECGEKFGRTDYLELHIRKHTNEKPFKCHICDKKYTMKRGLNTHLITHTNEKLHICNICKKAFNHRANMKRHVRTVHCEEKLHKCDICNRTFNSTTAVRLHKNVHSIDAPFPCNECNRKFRHQSALRGHLKAHHNNVIASRPTCAICNKTFTEKNTLRLHMRFMHIQADYRPYECKICSSKFKVLYKLNDHITTVHKKEKRYKCGDCKKQFVHKQTLKFHLTLKCCS